MRKLATMFLFLICLTTVISVINGTNLQLEENSKIHKKNLVPESFADQSREEPSESLISERDSDGESQLLTTTFESLAINDGQEIASGRSIDSRNEYQANLQSIAGKADDRHEAFRKRAKPLKNIVMGIYKNYKSTYLGNRTLTDYKRTLVDRVMKAGGLKNVVASGTPSHSLDTEDDDDDEEKVENVIDETTDEASTEDVEEKTTSPTVNRKEEKSDSYTVLEKEMYKAMIHEQRRLKKKHKYSQGKGFKSSKIAPPSGKANDPLIYVHDNEYRYNMGPGVNMSLDLKNDIVSVNLDADNLREIMYQAWYRGVRGQSDEGRGKKYEMITRVLPLFILPFLIQSAVVPFLVTKLKLLLMKSILVGKLAIFLLIISAIKNSNKHPQTYEVGPSYWAGEPSRRSELAAAASSSGAYNGYRVEGKPAAWIN